MNKPLPIAVAAAVAVVVASFVLAGCGDKESSEPTGAPNIVEADTITLKAQDAEVYAAVPGTVVAVQSVQVASRLMGYIKDIAVVEGQPVRAGQRLFTIDPADIEGGVAQARLGADQATKAMQDAKADYERFSALYKDEVATRQQYEKMKLNYDIAASRAAQAKAGLDTAEGQLKYAVVMSPIDGVVVQKFANQGDIAAPGHPIVMVENASRLQVQTAVSEEIYANLEMGEQIMVEVDGLAEAVEAEVARLSPAADPVAHTHLVKLDIDAKGLRSGAFARVLFPTGSQSMLKVPVESVLNRAGIVGVFVVSDRGVAEYRMVRTGRTANDEVEILSGLAPDDRVVTRNAAALSNGDVVRE